MSSDKPSYVVHVKGDCPWCVRAKALLDHYGADYVTTESVSDEWPTWPVIYRQIGEKQELIGGYNELCALALGGPL